ncbi:MAG: thiamine-phosphate kinase [Alcaligenaceae bacterium]|nr:thiamine-phosphate kinase [Alcaligenaceae bacterium]
MGGEFTLIGRYFDWPAPPGILGVGDDCALLPVSPGHRLAVTTDLLVEGRHFFPDTCPEALGHKALAVNVSDLAAMGARPLGCVLGLSLPRVDEAWLEKFSRGFRALSDEVGCPLVGGDTTRSVAGVIISVTAMGEVSEGAALKRSAAKPGDDIWVTGSLGAAHVALELLQGQYPEHAALLDTLRPWLERPQPPVAFGSGLSGLARAAIDISDGLLQDLGHILKASGCGADLDYSLVPAHPALKELDAAIVQRAVLNGGDVYQLCFTADAAARADIKALALRHGIEARIIGRIRPGQGIHVSAAPVPLGKEGYAGFDHFG